MNIGHRDGERLVRELLRPCSCSTDCDRERREAADFIKTMLETVDSRTRATSVRPST